MIASTLPAFMSYGVHHLEAWSEAVAGGAWGGAAARFGEWLRRAVDLEHWPAFQRSFRTMVQLLDELASGRRGAAPATITLLGGDVHTAYVAEVALPGPARSRVFQLTCSPFRNPLDTRERLVVRVLATRPAGVVAGWLARRAGVTPTDARWRFRCGPTFDNSIAVLALDERSAEVVISRSGPEEEGGPPLSELHRVRLATSGER